MPQKFLLKRELVDCPTQLTLMTWIYQLYSMTNTSEKYERSQHGNLQGDGVSIQLFLKDKIEL